MRPIRLRLGHFAHFTLEAQQMRATRVATLSHSAVCERERERESERERENNQPSNQLAISTTCK